jgi:putative zinc finger protein
MSVHVEEFLGAWALDAVDGVEAATIQAHLRQCPECAASAERLRSAAGWLGAEYVSAPPPRMRSTILDEARRRRPPVELRTLIEAYARQVRLLDETLRGLSEADWRRPDPRHGDIDGLVRHLTRNDAALAADLALPVITSTLPAYQAWREQADVLLHRMPSDADLAGTVRLAARTGDCRGTLRDAMVQRAFETWIHLDDIHISAGAAPSNPPPEHVHRIVTLAVGLLPGVLRSEARTNASLRLTGMAGGEWTLPIGDVTIRTDATDFARLVANRQSPGTLAYTAVGDRELAQRVLAIAATLGCD